MNSPIKLAALCIAIVSCMLIGKPAGADPVNRVEAELLSDVSAIQPGKPFTIGLRLHIIDGWHVYWINPGDAGAPTTFKIELPPGFLAGPVQYPVPEKLTVQGLTVYGYQHEVMLTETITPPGTLDRAVVTFPAHSSWCVCTDQMCVLGKRDIGISLPVSADSHPDNVDVFAGWKSRMPISADEAFSSVGPFFNISSNSNQVLGDAVVVWRKSPPSADIQWIPGPSSLINKVSEVKTDGQNSRIHLEMDRVEGIPDSTSIISGILAYYVPGQPPRGVAVELAALH